MSNEVTKSVTSSAPAAAEKPADAATGTLEMEKPAAVAKPDEAAKTAEAVKAAAPVEAENPVKFVSPAKTAAPARKPAVARAKKPAKPRKVAVRKTAKSPRTAKAPITAKPIAAKKAAKKTAAVTRVQSKASKAPQPEAKQIKTKDVKTMPSKTENLKIDVKAAVADVQEKSKEVYKMSGKLLNEGTEIAKANLKAVKQSGSIVAEGLKSMGGNVVEGGRSVVETLADDMKAVVGVKSTSAMLELQGKLAARNFDAVVGFASKSTSNVRDLASKAFAPISKQAKANIAAARKAA